MLCGRILRTAPGTDEEKREIEISLLVIPFQVIAFDGDYEGERSVLARVVVENTISTAKEMLCISG